LKSTAKDDWSKIREHIRMLCGIRHKQIPDLSVALESTAVGLLTKSGELCKQDVRAIRAVAEALLKEVDGYGVFKINRSEIDAAIKSVKS
jgi:hypothetical protein